MLVAAAVTVLITKLDSNKVLDQPVFKTGMFAVVLAFGLCWLVNTFIADQSSFITDNMSVLTNEHPWIYIIAVFIVGAITTSQSSSTMIMVPIGIALGFRQILLLLAGLHVHQIILFLLPVSALQQLRLIPREQQKLENMC